MDSKVVELLNDQVNKEFYSAYLYLEFANYYDSIGLDGFENWYRVQAQEERDHAMLFYDYLHNNDIKVELKATVMNNSGNPSAASVTVEIFDPATGKTKVMRKKEFAHDYRYFPEPDLLPLVLDDAMIEQIKAEMVELPDAKKARFVRDLGLTPYDASVLCESRETAEWFEKAAHGHDAKKVANWMMGDFFGMLNEKKIMLEESPISPENLGKLVDLITSNVINGKTAKDVFEIMAETGDSPDKIVEERGLKQVTDTGAIEAVIDEVIAANPDNVAAYRGGKVALMGWFVGQVMKASKGKANPGMVNELLKKKLS